MLLLLSTVFFTRTFAQGPRIIRFRQQQLTSKPLHYYIAAVKDDRTDTTSIGSVRSGIFSKKMASLDLPGGAASALNEFMRANLVQDRTRTPFVLHILQLEVGEKTGGLKAESEVRMTLAFYGAGKKITEYKVSNTVQSGVDASRFIEELIRRGLDNTLQQFDTWFGANRESVLAAIDGPSVRVTVEIKEATADPERIGFSLHRPLTLDDFSGKPDDLSRAAAITFSGIDVKYDSETQYGQVRVRVTIVPFFDRTRSWCRTASANKKTLAHEQRHFDITAIKACELAILFRQHSFTPGNYTNELQQLYQQKEKETQEWQDQYDSETHHGLIADMQAQWEKKIDGTLHEQPCY